MKRISIVVYLYRNQVVTNQTKIEEQHSLEKAIQNVIEQVSIIDLSSTCPIDAKIKGQNIIDATKELLETA